ncbi:MAG: hypothetical protein SVT56_11945 [Chloroflexota bacterium]|nr:hypothetical protein [Chloroflexota bacterium]
MKRSIAFSLAIVLSLLGGLLFISVQNVFATTEPPQELTPVGPSQSQETQPIVEGAVHTLYFYANDCPHCIEVIEEVLLPLKEKHGDLLDLRLLEISILDTSPTSLRAKKYP